jgi:hypothetical protein
MEDNEMAQSKYEMNQQASASAAAYDSSLKKSNDIRDKLPPYKRPATDSFYFGKVDSGN